MDDDDNHDEHPKNSGLHEETSKIIGADEENSKITGVADQPPNNDEIIEAAMEQAHADADQEEQEQNPKMDSRGPHQEHFL